MYPTELPVQRVLTYAKRYGRHATIACMAKRVIEEYISDLSGDPVDSKSPAIEFALEGVVYTIDLTDGEKNDLRQALAPFIAVAQKHTSSRRTSSTGADPKAVRAWAKENGIAVPARGRIPADVAEAYRSAH